MSIRAKTTACTCALIGLALSAAPAQAGFLDFLFGPPRPPAPVFEPPAIIRPTVSRAELEARARARRARQEARDEASRALTKERLARLKEILQEEGAMAAFQADPTLRGGDIVVTQTGIDVFHGSSGASHSARDFTPVAAMRGGDRAALIQLERVSRLNAKPAHPAATAAVEPASLTISRRHATRRAPLDDAKLDASEVAATP